jgi:hypothetical protein
LDPLERIPATARLTVLTECARVAKRTLVLAAPYGSDAHRIYERRLDALYTASFGTPPTYLNEHVRYGIPNQRDLERLFALVPLKSVILYFAGGFMWQCRHLGSSITRRGNPWMRRYLTWHFKALFHRIRLTRRPYPRANRVYLYAERHA